MSCVSRRASSTSAVRAPCEGRPCEEALALWRGTPLVGLGTSASQTTRVAASRSSGSRCSRIASRTTSRPAATPSSSRSSNSLSGNIRCANGFRVNSCAPSTGRVDRVTRWRPTGVHGESSTRSSASNLGRSCRSSSGRSSRRIRSSRRSHLCAAPRRDLRATPPLCAVRARGACSSRAQPFGIVHATGGQRSSDPRNTNSLAVLDRTAERLVKVIPIGATPRGRRRRPTSFGSQIRGRHRLARSTRSARGSRRSGAGSATDLVEAHGRRVGRHRHRQQHRAPEPADRRGVEQDGVDLGSSCRRSCSGGRSRCYLGRDWWLGRQGRSQYGRSSPRFAATLGESTTSPWATARSGSWTYPESSFACHQKTLRPTSSTELGVIPVAVTVAYGGVWVAVPDPIRTRVSLWGIDPQTVRVVQTIDVGPGLSYLPSLELTSGAGSLWVTNYDAGTVVRVDPASGKVMSTIRVGGHPFGIAFGDNRIWVTVS